MCIPDSIGCVSNIASWGAVLEHSQGPDLSQGLWHRAQSGWRAGFKEKGPSCRFQMLRASGSFVVNFSGTDEFDHSLNKQFAEYRNLCLLSDHLA